MRTTTRRAHLVGLAGAAAAAVLPRALRAQATATATPTPATQIAAEKRAQAQAAADAIPPEGIGHRIRHLSYSDHGRPARRRADHGEPRPPLRRPHVQRRRHDSRRADPRRVEARRLLHAGGDTRARIICRSPTICCCSPTAPTSSRCSPTTTCAATSRTRSPTASPTARSSARASQHSRHLATRARCARSRSSRCRASASIGCGGPGGRYAYVSAHFDGFTDHILCIVDLQDITKPEIVSRGGCPA